MNDIRPQNSSPYILSLDPSLTAFGWVITRGTRIILAGCIKTAPANKKLRIRKGDDRTRRVSEIVGILFDLIKEYNVTYIISELPHGSQSAVAAIALGLVTGAVQAMADVLGIGLEWFSEADAKKAVLGKNSATKQEMIDKIHILYNYRVPWTNTKYKDEAIADSLAIHYVAMKQSPTLKMIMK